MKTKQTFKQKLAEKFSWDVSDLPAYVDENAENIEADIVRSSNFLSRVTVDEGVKGKKTIKVMTGNVAIQEVSDCEMTDDGSIIFEGVDVETKTIGFQLSMCNQDLEQTWAQMLLAIGANNQNRELPLEDVIAAWTVKTAQKKAQDLIFNGDTGSLNPELAIFDGLVKKWNADSDLVVASGTFPMTASNAFANFLNVYDAIPSELFDNGIETEIVCSRADARLLIANIFNTKDYSASFSVEEANGELSFILPTTTTRVRSYAQLTTGQVYAVPYRYVVVGTDLADDLAGFDVKYLEEAEKLRISNKMKLGVNYIFGKYFVRLSNPTS